MRSRATSPLHRRVYFGTVLVSWILVAVAVGIWIYGQFRESVAYFSVIDLKDGEFLVSYPPSAYARFSSISFPSPSAPQLKTLDFAAVVPRFGKQGATHLWYWNDETRKWVYFNVPNERERQRQFRVVNSGETFTLQCVEPAPCEDVVGKVAEHNVTLSFDFGVELSSDFGVKVFGLGGNLPGAAVPPGRPGVSPKPLLPSEPTAKPEAGEPSAEEAGATEQPGVDLRSLQPQIEAQRVAEQLLRRGMMPATEPGPDR